MTLPAQQSNASISGHIIDPSGVAIPGASVEARNVDTNFTVRGLTSAAGNYFLGSLPTGSYEVKVQAAGFRDFTRQGIILAVSDKAEIAVTMQLGEAAQSITVKADLTAVENDQTVMSAVTTGREAAEVPMAGRQVFQFLLYSVGVVQSYVGADARDTSWSSNGDYSIHGSRPNTNAFLMDGAPMGSRGIWTMAPLSDSVEEFKVASPITDASYGLTGGGVINVKMKAGTNQFHGTLSEALRNGKMDANQTQLNQALATSPYLTKVNTWNIFSAMLGGPIKKNRLFFNAYYDGARMRDGSTLTSSIPTLLQRTGDFSQTLNSSKQLVQIYDPLTTTLTNGHFLRDPFPGNVIPQSRIVKPATSVMALLPNPNIVLDPVTQLNNWIAAPNPGSTSLNNEYSKFDYVWNQAHRTTGSQTYTWDRNLYWGARYGEMSPLNNGGLQERWHQGAILNHVWVAGTSGFVVDSRLGWDRWMQRVTPYFEQDYDVSGFGFQGQTGSYPVSRLPQFNFSGGYTTYGIGNFTTAPDDTYSFNVDVSKPINKHLLKFGGTAMRNIFSRYGGAFYPFGLFSFNSAFTQQDAQNSSPSAGNPIASMLLGYPASGQTQYSVASTYENRSLGLYIQDDLNLTRRIKLYYGVRWDVQTAPIERYNRQIYTFDPNVSYTLGPATAKGGFVYADPDHRQPWDTKFGDIQPRLGIAAQLTKSIVFRAGYGRSFLPENGGLGGGGIQQDGFSRTTNMTVVTGSGASVYTPGQSGMGTLVNPFPGGILLPIGSSLGPRTSVGQAVSFTQRGFEQGRVQQFNVGFSFDLPFSTTGMVSYVGNLTRSLRITVPLNVLPASVQDRIAADPTLLSTSVPNPYYGASQLAGTTLATPTLSFTQANLPYPQFLGVSDTGSPRGRSKYNGLELHLQRRFAKGLTMNLNYTYSKSMEALTYNSNKFTVPWSLSPYDRTTNLSAIALWEVPVGKGRHYASNIGSTANAFLGGWQVNVAFSYMNGIPLPMPANAVVAGETRLPEGQQTLSQWFNTCTLLQNGSRANCLTASQPVAWQQPAPGQIVYNSAYFPNIRQPWEPQVQFSLFKSMKIMERLRMELRGEAFNLMNTPIYSAPNTSFNTANFGTVATSQYNRARNIQLSLRLIF